MALSVMVLSQVVLLRPRLNFHSVEGFLLKEMVSGVCFQLFLFDIIAFFFVECLNLVEDILFGKLWS